METKLKTAAGLFITGVFVFAIFKGCSADASNQKETAGDYFTGEYFKATIETPVTDRETLIRLAGKERLNHGDKEGGIIKFVHGNKKQFAFVEYHFPANPSKVTDKDEFGREIEVKIFE